MRVLDLALKDLSQIFRDKRALLFLVVMPVVFTIFMGFAYTGGGEATAQDNRTPLGWVNQDPDGSLSTKLYDLLENSKSIRLVELTPEQANEAVRSGDVAGVLHVPTRYSQQINGNPVPLTLTTDLNTAQGQSIFQQLRSPVTQLMSSVEIARLSAETADKANDPTELEAAFSAASQSWMDTNSAALIQVEMAVSAEKADWYGDNPYNQASPGILVQFAIFGLVTSGQILVQERKSRTLQRMISTSMRPWQIIAGHTLAMFALVFIQELLMITFGQLILGVDYARQPLAILLISTALGLWVAAMGLLIGVLAKDDSQVVLVSLMAMFVFSAMGGMWFPLEATGGAFATIGKLMPSAWAMNGYQNILIRLQGLESAWVPSLALLGYALGFFALAVWGFRKLKF